MMAAAKADVRWKNVRMAVPFHAQKVLHPKLLRSIMHDAGIGLEELGTLLR